MDRRQFLRNSAVTAGSAGTTFALQESLQATSSARKGKTYRVGIIGSTGKGNYGHGLDTVWKTIPQVQIAAVADDNPSGLEQAITRTTAPKGYHDYRQMIDKEQLDIVAVCPRWVDQHHEMVMYCASHNCHVYMEKPFTQTLEDADDIIQAFQSRNLKLAIAHVNRYRSQVAHVKKLISDGVLGNILEVRGRGKEDRRGGGEDLWVLGTHVLDLMRLFIGDVETCYAQVLSDGKSIVREDVIDGNEGLGLLAGDSINAMYRFSNGVMGHFSSHRNQRGDSSRFGIKIFGSLGVLEFLSAGPVHLLEDSAWSTARSKPDWIPLLPNNTPEGNEAAVLDLIQAIEMDRQPISGMYDARAATEMIVAVFESHRLGKPVSFPLKNRRNPLSMLSSRET